MFDKIPPGTELVDPESYARLEPIIFEKNWERTSKVSLEIYFPPAGDQGKQGSCSAWAAGYALRTYHMASMNSGWNKNIPEYQFSPSYIYNQLNNDPTCEDGISILDTLKLLKEEGIVTMKDFPFEPNCKKKPSNNLKRIAKEFKIKWYGTTMPKIQRPEDLSDAEINGFKLSLQNNQPPLIIVRSYTCMNLFKKINGVVKNVYDINILNAGKDADIHELKKPYHAMVVTGYDDDRGAFRVFSSWGRDWGENGYIWIKYDVFGAIVYQSYVIKG